MGRLSGSIGVVIGVVAVASVAFWLWTSEPPRPPEDPRPPYVLPVTLAAVTRGDVQPEVTLTGTVRSPARADLAFEVGGVVESIEVREADIVEAGAVIAKLRAREQELDVVAAEAQLVLAEREHAKLVAGARDEEKKRLAAERDVRKAEEELAVVEVERGKKLVTDRVLSQADLDRLEAVRASASARLRSAQHELEEAEAGTRSEDLAIAEAKVALERARVELARERANEAVLRAPNAGTVLDRRVAVGDYVPAGDPVVELVDLSSLEIEVEVPPETSARVGERPAVVVTVDELPGIEIAATLDATIPAADERSRNFTGIIRLPGADGAQALQPGMFVRLSVPLAPVRDALVVPADAVRITEQGPVVVTATEDASGALSAAWIPVRRVASDGARTAVEATDGELTDGSRVVVTGVDLAFPGVALLDKGSVRDETREAGGPGGEPGADDSSH